MDIFSHGLWAAAAYKGTNDFILKPKQKINLREAAMKLAMAKVEKKMKK